MAVLADRLPLAEIASKAQSWDPVRFWLTLVMAPLFALGWLAGKVVTVVLRHVARALWVAGTWVAAAVMVGYRAGRGSGTVSRPT